MMINKALCTLVFMFLWMIFPSALLCDTQNTSFQVEARAVKGSNIRKIPSMSGEILGWLKPGERVNIDTMENEWFKIRRTDGLTGWVYYNLIKGHAQYRKRLVDGQRVKPQIPPDKKAISLSFRDMDIRDAFSSLAMEFKTNIVLSSSVSGAITLHIFSADLDEAISAIASAGGFSVEKKNQTYYVIPAKREIEKQGPIVAEPFEIQNFRLNFIEIDQVREVLNSIPGIQPVQVHENTKSILVEDTRANIQKIKQMISFLDAVPKQVMIEAKILEVILTDDMAYGVDWQTLWRDGGGGTNDFSNAVLPATSGVSPVPLDGAGIFANLFTKIGDNGTLGIAIDALKGKTKVKTLSTPKIMAIHGHSARVQVGGKQGYRVTTSNLGVVTETIEFIDTGVILDITPHIDENNNILLNVLPTINTAKIEEGIPVVNSTSAATWMIARDGETVLIGGLIENIEGEKREQIPILGDIPIMGNLFGRTVTNEDKIETVIMITPHIINTPYITNTPPAIKPPPEVHIPKSD